MLFLNSLLLYGTALGSVPIIIHLLNKRRFRPVTWAAMEFLLQAIQKNARRLQLRDIILMLIRAAAVIFLALAMARPALFSKALFGGHTGAVILLDNSMSMGYNNGRETRFDTAKRLAKSILAQLDQGSWCALYTFNDEPHEPLGDPSQNLAYIEQELDRSVQLSDGGTHIEKALLRVKKLFETRLEYKWNREIYVITDMQSSSWAGQKFSAGFKDLVKDLSTEASFYLVDAGDAAAENAAILDLGATDTIVAVDMPVSFVAKIKNFGKADLRALPVDFYVDDKPVERSTVNVPGGEVASLSFETRFKTGGDNKVEVRLAEDHLCADNHRYCSVEVVDETHVLLVDGSSQQTNNPLFSETGYLQLALSPQDPDNPDKQSVVTTETVWHDRFGDRNILNYQAIALVNVRKIPAATLAVLQRQVRSGLGLMVFLGDQIDAQEYNSLLGEAGAKLLPAKIGAPWGVVPTLDAINIPPAFSFATDAGMLSHPIMSDFNNPDYGTQFLSAVKIYRAFELEPLKDESVRVVAWLSNGKPAIIERKIGAGFVLLFAFPPTAGMKGWSNLPMQPLFTVLMQRATHRLTQGNHRPKNLSVNDAIICDVSVSDQSTRILINAPAHTQRKETRPELRPDGSAAFEFNETENAGFYDVSLDRVPIEKMVYAFNSNSAGESDLAVIQADQLQREYPDFQFNFVGKSDDFSHKFAGQRRGIELWPWLLGAVFMCLALESILAFRWSPRD